MNEIYKKAHELLEKGGWAPPEPGPEGGQTVLSAVMKDQLDREVTRTHPVHVRVRAMIYAVLVIVGVGFWVSSWRGVLWSIFFLLLIGLAGGLVWAIRHPARDDTSRR